MSGTGSFKQGYSTLPSVEDDLLSRPSFSYYKLPQQLLNLSILKLDGSSFDVQVSRSANIAELKLAVEDVFGRSPEDEGEGKISWTHVWGHFCLCYDGHELLNDEETLWTFGIRDGDQLAFKRHVSINYNPVRKPSRNYRTSRRKHKTLSAGSDIYEEKLEKDESEYDNLGDHVHHDNNENFIVKNIEFKLAHFLKGWLSFSRLWCRRMKLEGRTCSLKLGRN